MRTIKLFHVFLVEVMELCQQLGIKQIRSRSYHPQSQGKIERSHGTWKRKIQFDIDNEESTLREEILAGRKFGGFGGI